MKANATFSTEMSIELEREELEKLVDPGMSIEGEVIFTDRWNPKEKLIKGLKILRMEELAYNLFIDLVFHPYNTGDFDNIEYYEVLVSDRGYNMLVQRGIAYDRPHYFNGAKIKIEIIGVDREGEFGDEEERRGNKKKIRYFD